MVEIRSCSLVNLSLAGCRTMTSLKLSCPSLKKVNLDGCDHLEVANFSPVSELLLYKYTVAFDHIVLDGSDFSLLYVGWS